jgi:hypothetical protein
MKLLGTALPMPGCDPWIAPTVWSILTATHDELAAITGHVQSQAADFRAFTSQTEQAAYNEVTF